MFEKDITEGITILNRHDLGWAHRIDVDNLDFGWLRQDILSQLYEDWSEVYTLVIADYEAAETFCGFSIQDARLRDPRQGILTREWQKIIRYIQKNIPADEPFEATLGSLWEREG